MQLDQRLAKSTRIAQISTRNDDPVGDLPAQAFKDAIDDRLLPFEAKRD